MPRLPALFLAISLTAPPIAGQVAFIAGPAKALSGTTILMEDPAGRSVRLRLAGLAAPAERMRCLAAGGNLPDWGCGTGSLLALASVIDGEILECRLLDADAGDLPAAECLAQTRNVNEWMLMTGRAILLPEWRGRNPEWDSAELLARRAGAMLWSGFGR